MGRPNPFRETKFSGANRDKKIFISPVQLTTSRIVNLTRLIYTLLYVMTNHALLDHSTYVWSSDIAKYCCGQSV